MTDRDYFAAAALTRGMGVLGYDQIAKSCYEMADAMLREREQTNHDAAPEALQAEVADLRGKVVQLRRVIDMMQVRQFAVASAVREMTAVQAPPMEPWECDNVI